MKRSPLKRKTWMRKVRKEPRPGRLKGEDMTELREAVWARDGGLCCFCGKPVDFVRGEMAHLRNKRMWQDHIDNIKGPSHKKCHEDSHNCGGKPLPRGEWRRTL